MKKNTISTKPLDQIFSLGNLFYETVSNLHNFNFSAKNKILICGMGGSGISANYFKTLVEYYELKPLIIINKNYTIPHYIDTSWNVIIISYSGNTEETLIMIGEILERGIEPITITSGGKLMEIAKANSLQNISVQTNFQPRYAFPLLFGSIVGIFRNNILKGNLDLKTYKNNINNIQYLTNESQRDKDLDRIIDYTNTHLPLILSSNLFEPIAVRLRCQLNENSKVHGISLVVPEFSHNGIVGFDRKHPLVNISVIVIKSQFDTPSVRKQIDIIQSILKEKNIPITELSSDCNDFLSQLIQLTIKVDYISFQIATKQNIDPITVPSINNLKKLLKQ